MKSLEKCNAKWSLIALSIFAMPVASWANPEGPSVVAGSASFQETGPGALHIETSDRAIINWQDFSIGAGEVTKFIQPSAQSAVLNRVMSGNPSELFGRLEANGRIYLINPNGLVVGKDAVIDTAHFLSSTLDCADEAFLNNQELLFSGSSSAVILNLGVINAWDGDVVLIGYKVDN